MSRTTGTVLENKVRLHPVGGGDDEAPISKPELKLAATGLVFFPFAASLFGLGPRTLPILFVAAVGYLGYPGLIAAFLIAPVAFYFWARHTMPGAPVSFAALVAVVAVAAGSWFYLSHAAIASYEIWPVEYYETMNLIYAVVLAAIAAASWRYRNTRLALLFEWLFLGWLISFAFPYLWDLP